MSDLPESALETNPDYYEMVLILSEIAEKTPAEIVNELQSLGISRVPSEQDIEQDINDLKTTIHAGELPIKHRDRFNRVMMYSRRLDTLGAAVETVPSEKFDTDEDIHSPVQRQTCVDERVEAELKKDAELNLSPDIALEWFYRTWNKKYIEHIFA